MKLRELYSTQNYPPREEDHQKNSVSPRRAATPVRQAETQRKTFPFAAAEKSNQNFVVGICAFIVLSESESTSKFMSQGSYTSKSRIVSHENFPVCNAQSLRT